MTSKAYKLTPVDSWFFRDGRPFNQGETNQTDVISLFPPFATTVVGAVRASLARGLGWSGRGGWATEIKDKLGDGQDLGPLRFRGPYLVRKVNGEEEMLFPAPLHLLGKRPEGDESRWTRITRLHPGEEIDCDIGKKVKLPKAENASGLKLLSGCYFTADDLETILGGNDLSRIKPVSSKQLREFEYSVGIERQQKTRTTEEGALYSTRRVRLKPGVGLAVQVEGLDQDMEMVTPLLLGGESRLAWVKALKEQIRLPEAPALASSGDGKVRFTITHLTPAYFDAWPGPWDDLPGVPGSKVVSACLERPLRIGGWDSFRREPLPLKPFLPAGSTWFCEAKKDHEEEIRQLNGHHIGECCEQGFGQIVIGLWSDDEEVNK